MHPHRVFYTPNASNAPQTPWKRRHRVDCTSKRLKHLYRIPDTSNAPLMPWTRPHRVDRTSNASTALPTPQTQSQRLGHILSRRSHPHRVDCTPNTPNAPSMPWTRRHRVDHTPNTSNAPLTPWTRPHRVNHTHNTSNVLARPPLITYVHECMAMSAPVSGGMLDSVRRCPAVCLTSTPSSGGIYDECASVQWHPRQACQCLVMSVRSALVSSGAHADMIIGNNIYKLDTTKEGNYCVLSTNHVGLHLCVPGILKSDTIDMAEITKGITGYPKATSFLSPDELFMTVNRWCHRNAWKRVREHLEQRVEGNSPDELVVEADISGDFLGFLERSRGQTDYGVDETNSLNQHRGPGGYEDELHASRGVKSDWRRQSEGNGNQRDGK
ncbi:hypothetical protein OG21DRAFT_1603768 [Imleria badia]|nr:hypothetical protein OG21DRAFT_1603768 [Imleria badia]